MCFHLYNFNNSCKEFIFFFSPIEILFGLRNIGLLFMHMVLLVFGDSVPVCLYPVPSSVCSPSLMAEGPRGLECGPNTSYRQTILYFQLEAEQHSKDDFRVFLTMNCLKSPFWHGELWAPVTQALHLFYLLGISRAMAGSPFAFPGSWFHSEFNEGAELSGQGRVSPSGTPLEGFCCLVMFWVTAACRATPRKGLSS